MWQQIQVRIPSKPRGFHLVTRELLEPLRNLDKIQTGMATFFLQHTSASLCLGENADPTVRQDFESFFRKSVPDGQDTYRHTLEGPDDITAHLKAAIIGGTLQVPIQSGQLALGTWQGIYLGEHRENAGSRSVLVTLQGE